MVRERETPKTKVNTEQAKFYIYNILQHYIFAGYSFLSEKKRGNLSMDRRCYLARVALQVLNACGVRESSGFNDAVAESPPLSFSSTPESFKLSLLHKKVCFTGGRKKYFKVPRSINSYISNKVFEDSNE